MDRRPALERCTAPPDAALRRPAPGRSDSLAQRRCPGRGPQRPVINARANSGEWKSGRRAFVRDRQARGAGEACGTPCELIADRRTGRRVTLLPRCPRPFPARPAVTGDDGVPGVLRCGGVVADHAADAMPPLRVHARVRWLSFKPEFRGSNYGGLGRAFRPAQAQRGRFAACGVCLLFFFLFFFRLIFFRAQVS